MQLSSNIALITGELTTFKGLITRPIKCKFFLRSHLLIHGSLFHERPVKRHLYDRFSSSSNGFEFFHIFDRTRAGPLVSFIYRTTFTIVHRKFPDLRRVG